MNLSMKQKWIHRQGERGEGEMDWEFGTSICKLLHRKQINNEVLLYNYTQNPVINYNGKEYEK